ncbi:MAG: hypothetical protein ABEK59_13370 [Halobacteria archaeon]
MGDVKFPVAATVAVTLIFVLQLGFAESLPEGIRRWGVLAALVVFILLSSFAGLKISDRMYR